MSSRCSLADATRMGPTNDVIAPEPGFSVAQYERLALI
jgi:hypothetical protein